MERGTRVRHLREPQRGVGEVKFEQSVAGEPYAYVGWPNEPGALKQHPINDLEAIVPLWKRVQSESVGPAAVNRYLLRVLGRWFEARNALTGELSNQPFQMLPHQVLVTSRVVNSRAENRRWLVADDVGLGKTIEAGMIMEVLRKQSLGGRFRCLVITPAGLLNQWEEEMRDRFGRRFVKFGTDVNALQHERLLLASIDTLKNHSKYGNALRFVEPWDLVIFDEAHHLATEKSVERYKLAERLLEQKDGLKARNVLFLTATPHSGNTKHFSNMLQLLRGDLFRSVDDVTSGDGRLNQVMIRNRKTDVQDAKGNRLFFGVTSQVVQCEPTPAEIAFFEQLSAYFKQGYGAADKLKKQAKNSGEANAVSFVMTTFRKLASSSRAAIRRAIERRHATLTGGDQIEELDEVDERFEGEEWERRVAAAAIQAGRKKGRKVHSYVTGELEQLESLLATLNKLGDRDSKQELFSTWLNRLPSEEKALIFTEYRGTQDSLEQLITRAFGPESIGLINGGMKREQRRAVVHAFNEQSQPRFLVSTEAGGEGLNMQKACRNVVNYDLPWNPTRLQQRIGRVYRYGQKRRVQVFSFKLHREGSEAFVDGRVEELLRGKIREISQSFAQIQGEEIEDVEGEVLGTVVANVNIDQLYEEALRRGEQAAKDMIDAKSAHLEQIMRDPKGMLGLFRGLKRFNLTDYESVATRVNDDHLEFFLRQYLAETTQQHQQRITQDGLISFGVPRQLREHAERIVRGDPTEAREPIGERIERATVSKQRARETTSCRLLRFGDLAFDAMVSHVQSSDFSVGIASLSLPASLLGWTPGTRGVSAIFDLRVLRQTDKTADILRTQLVSYLAPVGGEPVEWEGLFDALPVAHPGTLDVDAAEVKRAYDAAYSLAETALAALRQYVADELGAVDGIVPVLDDFALAWFEAV